MMITGPIMVGPLPMMITGGAGHTGSHGAHEVECVEQEQAATAVPHPEAAGRGKLARHQAPALRAIIRSDTPSGNAAGSSSGSVYRPTSGTRSLSGR